MCVMRDCMSYSCLNTDFAIAFKNYKCTGHCEIVQAVVSFL